MRRCLMAKRGVLEHEKTFALADALGIPECYALGVLEAIWHWVAKYRPTGDLFGVPPSHVARAIRYPGDPQKLWTALRECRWIDDDVGFPMVHDWSEHAD